jgi:hypothetical protein
MVYLIENADEICEKFKPNHEYPPRQAAPQAASKVTRKARKRVNLGERQAALACDQTHANSALIFCFVAGSHAGRRPDAKADRHDAHDSLQMPVKYEDGVLQTHRQIRALV